jgi:metal-sulfur cluster biosynthetic enzyme
VATEPDDHVSETAGASGASAMPADAANDASASPESFPYEGPPELEAPLRAALANVVDPEIAMSIVDVGLVYGVTATPERVHVQMTMTSAACPVAESIVEEVEAELDRVVPPAATICVELVWDPPWTPERMSADGRRFMNW